MEEFTLGVSMFGVFCLAVGTGLALTRDRRWTPLALSGGFIMIFGILLEIMLRLGTLITLTKLP